MQGKTHSQTVAEMVTHLSAGRPGTFAIHANCASALWLNAAMAMTHDVDSGITLGAHHRCFLKAHGPNWTLEATEHGLYHLTVREAAA